MVANTSSNMFLRFWIQRRPENLGKLYQEGLIVRAQIHFLDLEDWKDKKTQEIFTLNVDTFSSIIFLSFRRWRRSEKSGKLHLKCLLSSAQTYFLDCEDKRPEKTRKTFSKMIATLSTNVFHMFRKLKESRIIIKISPKTIASCNSNKLLMSGR